MRAGALALLGSVALFGCTASPGSTEPPPGSDAGGFRPTDAGAIADAATVDAPPPDATAIPATVDVAADSCLFVLEGPGASFARLLCGADTGAFCNANGELCMPPESMVTITGERVDGPEPDICTHWYPVLFRAYEGFSCGDYLVLP